MVSSVIDLNSDAVRGLSRRLRRSGFFAGPAPLTAAGSGSTSVTYGPNRPSRATIRCPESGSTPSSFSPASPDWANSSLGDLGVDLVGGQILGQVGPLGGRLAVLAVGTIRSR